MAPDHDTEEERLRRHDAGHSQSRKGNISDLSLELHSIQAPFILPINLLCILDIADHFYIHNNYTQVYLMG